MLKYVARASVAVPFAIMLGFALGLAEQTDTQEVTSEATAQAFGQAPFALLGTLGRLPAERRVCFPSSGCSHATCRW
jgi:hypothetical protein